jgi:hypothetical protein
VFVEVVRQAEVNLAALSAQIGLKPISRKSLRKVNSGATVRFEALPSVWSKLGTVVLSSSSAGKEGLFAMTGDDQPAQFNRPLQVLRIARGKDGFDHAAAAGFLDQLHIDQPRRV